MRDEWEEVEDTLEDADTLYASSDEGGTGGSSPDDLSYTDQVQAYAADAREYVTELWESAIEEYVDHEMSGYDRFQEAITERAVEYSPDIENPYAEAVAETAVEFGRSYGQALAGSVLSLSSVYDGIQEWKQAGKPPISPFVQMEKRREEDTSIAEKTGKATGFVTGAALITQYPFVLLAGAAQTGRHLIERKAHDYLRERMLEEEEEGDADDDNGVQQLYSTVETAAKEEFDAALDAEEASTGEYQSPSVTGAA